jgi:uncharacterized protein (TIGR02302 family)
VSDRPETEGDPHRRIEGQVAQALLERALTRARWAILWERLWPALATLATAVGLFLAVSWTGLWLALPPMGRAAGLFILILVIAAGTVPILRLSMPSPFDGLRRLDRGAGLRHRPATAMADDLAVTPDDPVSTALWRAHVDWAISAARALKAGWPKPRLAARDPYALRALVLVLVVATFFAAGGERIKRITAAFDWAGVVAPANYRVDAWVTPPPYTARPPMILPGIRPGEPAQAARTLSVPVGSTLVIRASGTTNLKVTSAGGLEAASQKDGVPVPTGAQEHRFVIQDKGSVTLRGVGSEDVAWNFVAIPDKAPAITLVKDPELQGRGGLLLAYKVEDDYGVTEAHATFKLKESEDTPATARGLYGPPDFPLVLPQLRTRNGVGQTTKDLTEHPWAGADVTMTLRARDEGGNEGFSAPQDLRLPARVFVKPLAKALIEQRRNLALDANARQKVSRAIDALTIAPERFIPESGVYLGLRSVYWNLTNAKSDDDLREVVTRLWSMAVTIEDGLISDAEAALRAAQEALRQALERGASDEEIKRLTDQLRAALDRFMQALAEEMRKNGQQLARPLDRNAREIRPQDLRSMLDRIEELSRSGAKDAARRLLQELQSLLENLPMARPGRGQDMEGDDDMMSALDELGDMIRKQQQLRDRTFRQGQDARRGQRGQRGQRGERGEQGDGDQNQFGELQQNQKALREQLQKLLEELRKRGLGQNQDGQQGQGEDQLGRAGEAMGDAQGALGDGNADDAVDAQGRALDALRRGAQGLAQMMQQQMGPGPGQPGRNGQARANQDTDPLGRPLRGREYGDDTTVKVPGEIDVQRARRILEELRRRLSEPLRPQIELDYIERLLKDF